MRRRQTNALRAAGLIPPVAAHLREKWEAMWKEADLVQEGFRQAAQQSVQEIPALNPRTETIVAPIISAADVPVAGVAVWPLASDRTCPYCHNVLSRVAHLRRHLITCPERPRPEAAV